MLAVARNVAAADSSMKAGQWDRKKFTGCELDGKTLGVLGVGRIGRAVAVRMQAFGMKTVGYDPLVPPATMRENHVEPVELDKLWEMSDFITVHTPLLPSTKGESCVSVTSMGGPNCWAMPNLLPSDIA